MLCWTQVLLGLCFVAVVAGQARTPMTTADCETTGGKCVPVSPFSQCHSADHMCVGHCDGPGETCLFDKDVRCEKLRNGKCVEAIECVVMADHGPCRFNCKDGRVCCVPDSLRGIGCAWRRGLSRQRKGGMGRGYRMHGGHGQGGGRGRGFGGGQGQDGGAWH